MGVCVSGGVAHGDLDEFGGAFTVSDYELGEALGELGEDFLHGDVVW